MIEDLDGAEYSSLSEARISAVKGTREIMASRVAVGKQPNHSRFEIAEDSGNIVLVVPFSDAFDGGNFP